MLHLYLYGRKYVLKSFLSKVTYIAYLTIGGVFIEPGVDVKIRFFFILMQVWLFLVCIAGPTIYVFLYRHYVSLTGLLYIGIVVNGDLALWAGQLIFLLYRDNIKTAIKSMEENYGVQQSLKYVDVRKIINVRRIIPPMIFLDFCGIFGFVLPRPVEYAFARNTTEKTESGKSLFYSLAQLPIDPRDQFNIESIYWMHISLTVGPIFYILSITVVALLAVTIIPLVLYNHFISLTILIEKETRLYESKGEEIPPRIKCGDQRNCCRFVEYIKCYQTLQREVALVKEFMETIYSFVFIGTFTASVPTGSLFLTSEEIPISTLSSTAALVLLCIIYITIFSYIGTMLEGINTKLMLSVYDTPWYNLPSQYRRDLIIFMGHLQKPIVFNLYKIRPMTMALVVRFFHLNYTILNFIRIRLA